MSTENTATIAEVERFAKLLQSQQQEAFRIKYPGNDLERRVSDSCTVRVYYGPKYFRVDVGNSGKYMVVRDTGEIFGIKAYGVIHRGHKYGTLQTVDHWDWSGYVAKPKSITP